MLLFNVSTIQFVKVILTVNISFHLLLADFWLRNPFTPQCSAHQYSVVKLDGGGVLKNVLDCRREGEKIIWDPVFTHFWERVVHQSSIKASDEGSWEETSRHIASPSLTLWFYSSVITKMSKFIKHLNNTLKNYIKKLGFYIYIILSAVNNWLKEDYFLRSWNWAELFLAQTAQLFC